MMYNFNIEKPYAYLLKVWQDVLSEIGKVEGKELTIIEAEPEDALILEIREEQKDHWKEPTYDYCVRMHAWLNMISPMNYTIRHGNDIMLIINIAPAGEGVGEISFLTDVRFVSASKLVKFNLIRAFHKALDRLPFHRIQAKVKANFEIGKTFVEKLNFQAEGIMRKFGPTKEDYIMYSLIR